MSETIAAAAIAPSAQVPHTRHETCGGTKHAVHVALQPAEIPETVAPATIAAKHTPTHCTWGSAPVVDTLAIAMEGARCRLSELVNVGFVQNRIVGPDGEESSTVTRPLAVNKVPGGLRSTSTASAPTSPPIRARTSGTGGRFCQAGPTTFTTNALPTINVGGST